MPETGSLVLATFKSSIFDSSLKDIRFETINQIFTSLMYHFVAQRALPPGVQVTDGSKTLVLLAVGCSYSFEINEPTYPEINKAICPQHNRSIIAAVKLSFFKNDVYCPKPKFEVISGVFVCRLFDSQNSNRCLLHRRQPLTFFPLERLAFFDTWVDVWALPGPWDKSFYS